MAQDHGVVVAEVAHQPVALVEVERDAFVVVVAGAAEELHRHLVQRQQALLLRRHRHAGRGVAVHDALRIVARHVHRRMDGEARIVDPGLLELLDGVAFGIDGDQARRRDLVEQVAERVEQEAVVLARQAHRQMGEDQVVHAEAGEQAVGRGEVAAQFPFLGIDIVSVGHCPHHELMG